VKRGTIERKKKIRDKKEKKDITPSVPKYKMFYAINATHISRCFLVYRFTAFTSNLFNNRIKHLIF
jgi:hypothetical protein